MRRGGFSLLEIVVGIAIAGLILGMAVPRLAALRNGAAVRAAVGELGAIFSLARHEAIARRAPVAVVLHASPASVEVRSNGQRILARPLAAVYGVTLETNRDSAVYDPRGLGYGVSNLTVTVHRGEIVDTLTMSRLGRVRW